MAQLLRITRIIPKPVDEVDYVDLRLSGDEADVLYDILCVVGGSPRTSRREHIASLFDTLCKVYPSRDAQAPADINGRIFLNRQKD